MAFRCTKTSFKMIQIPSLGFVIRWAYLWAVLQRAFGPLGEPARRPTPSGVSKVCGPEQQLGGVRMQQDPSHPHFSRLLGLAYGVNYVLDSRLVDAVPSQPEDFTEVLTVELADTCLWERAGLSSNATTDEDTALQALESADESSSGTGSQEYSNSTTNSTDSSPEDDKEGEGGASFTFTAYAAPAFAKLHRRWGISPDDLKESFRLDGGAEAAMIEFAANSKSSQAFFFTHDGRFMIKTQSESELASLLEFLHPYADYMDKHPRSLITHFVGAYRVTNKQTGRSAIFSVTSNVFATDLPLHWRYDLKGSTVGRMCSEATRTQPTAVLKDLDLQEGGVPLPLGPSVKQALMKQLEEDSAFLKEHRLMDYSLLVGMHTPGTGKKGKGRGMEGGGRRRSWGPKRRREERRRQDKEQQRQQKQEAKLRSDTPWAGLVGSGGEVMYMGVIDVLQRYTLRKGLEAKLKGVIYDAHNISSVPPEEYQQRFLHFIDANSE